MLVGTTVLAAGLFGMIMVAYANTPLPVETQQHAVEQGSVIYPSEEIGDDLGEAPDCAADPACASPDDGDSDTGDDPFATGEEETADSDGEPDESAIADDTQPFEDG